jgi:hypothetical protein
VSLLNLNAAVANLNAYPKTQDEVASLIEGMAHFAEEVLDEHPQSSSVVFATSHLPSWLSTAEAPIEIAPGYLVGLVDLEPDAIFYLAAVLQADQVVWAQARNEGGSRNFVAWHRSYGMIALQRLPLQSHIRRLDGEEWELERRKLLPASLGGKEIHGSPL